MLDQLDGSGQSGVATLVASGDQTRLTVEVTPGPAEDDPQPVHIYLEQCGTGLGRVDIDLTDGGATGVVDGVLSTIVDAALDCLMDGLHAIDVHQSAEALEVETACGNVPAFILVPPPAPTGENLFAAFNKFVITVEPVPDPDPGPSDQVALEYTISAGGITEIRRLIFSWTGNPSQTVGFHEGTAKGTAVGLREQTWTAWVHADLALRSTTLADIQLHACHVVNIIEGTGDGKGEHFDPSCRNPGDGFGVLGYAEHAMLQASSAADGAPDDPVIVAHSREVVDSANNVRAWAEEARDITLQVQQTDSETVARVLMGFVVRNTLNWALNGYDANDDGTVERTAGEGGAKQAYRAAQDMGIYSLTPPPEPAPPAVGDPNIPRAALVALVLGVFLLSSGAFLFWRSRAHL